MKKLIVTAALISFLFLSGNVFAAIKEYNFYPRDGSPPQQGDIGDLNHDYLYSWLVKGLLPANETITSASLTFTNIINWRKEPHDLFVHLLNTPHTDNTPGAGSWQSLSPAGTTKDDGAVWYKRDSEGGGNAFDGYWSGTVPTENIPLFHYHETTLFKARVDGTLVQDDSGEKSFPAYGLKDNDTPKTIVYYFDTNQLDKLIEYFSNDNTFGIGLDPDCHYYNDGIILTLETRTPGTGDPVPEPATLLLFGSGLVALAGIGRKRLKK